MPNFLLEYCAVCTILLPVESFSPAGSLVFCSSRVKFAQNQAKMRASNTRRYQYETNKSMQQNIALLHRIGRMAQCHISRCRCAVGYFGCRVVCNKSPGQSSFFYRMYYLWAEYDRAVHGLNAVTQLKARYGKKVISDH